MSMTNTAGEGAIAGRKLLSLLLKCLAVMFCALAGVLLVLRHSQDRILIEMEEKSSEVLRGVHIAFTSPNQQDPTGAFHNRPHARPVPGHEVEELVLSHMNEAASDAEAASPALAFGVPGQAQFVEVEPEPGKKMIGYFQTFPLMLAERQVGEVRLAIALAPQTHLIKAGQARLVFVIGAILAAGGAIISYILVRSVGSYHAYERGEAKNGSPP